MTIEIKKQNNEAFIHVEGVIDATTAPALAKAISESAKSTPSIVLDLNGIDLISSEGLDAILGARSSMRAIGSLRLAGICESVMQLFEASAVAEKVSLTE